MIAVLCKEFKSYFYSVTGYIFLGVFLLFLGIFVSLSCLLSGSTDFVSVLDSMKLLFLFLVPVITMKIIAEETHQKTDQLLYTSPLSITDVVLGKYFAAFGLFLLGVCISFIYPLILSIFGKLPVAQIVSEYIGFILLGGCFVSVGLFISSLTENQVIAAVSTFGALLFLWLINSIQQGLPTTRMSGIIFAIIIAALITLVIYFSTKNLQATVGTGALGAVVIVLVYILKKTLFEGFTAKFFGWFSLLGRFDNFYMGILNISDIVYLLSFTFAFVFLTIRMIEKRRWN